MDIDDLSKYYMKYITEKFQVSHECVAKLRPAFFEMLVNAVEHGNLEMTDLKKNLDFLDVERYEEIFRNRKISNKYGEKLIQIECICEGNQLTISIEDDGSGFHPDTIPDPTREDRLSEPFGRGIAIARKNADQISYNNRGNKVSLVFNIGFYN